MNECLLYRLRESRQKKTREVLRQSEEKGEEEEHEEEEEEEEKEEEETRALDYTEKERTKRIVLFQTAAETRRRRVRDEAGPFRPLTWPYVVPFFPPPVRFDVVLL
ncbi:hypothetical protein K0M31_014362 [Melipona bicolor]|uniref:Uncharacterized protein n=1 Tax=Melipona bicolor TaxID=60889 RepID=A0AA40G8E2_9HYME|nr:hypothetical protein K0M31_014362 [Melipona bicolor]